MIVSKGTCGRTSLTCVAICMSLVSWAGPCDEWDGVGLELLVDECLGFCGRLDNSGIENANYVLKNEWI